MSVCAVINCLLELDVRITVIKKREKIHEDHYSSPKLHAVHWLGIHYRCSFQARNPSCATCAASPTPPRGPSRYTQGPTQGRDPSSAWSVTAPSSPQGS